MDARGRCNTGRTLACVTTAHPAISSITGPWSGAYTREVGISALERRRQVLAYQEDQGRAAGTESVRKSNVKHKSEDFYTMNVTHDPCRADCQREVGGPYVVPSDVIAARSVTFSFPAKRRRSSRQMLDLVYLWFYDQVFSAPAVFGGQPVDILHDSVAPGHVICGLSSMEQ